MRNILFVTIDCLRVDHVGAYGYDRPTTPRLDRLAERGEAVACYANSPGTRWAFQTLYAGVYTLQIDGIGLPASGGTTVAEVLSEAGYATAGFANNAYLTRLHDMDRGFDTFHGGTRFARAVQGDQATVERAINWLTDRSEPWYCHVHLMDAHGPWARRDDLLERIRGDTAVEHVERAHEHVTPGETPPERVVDAYDAGIASADRALGRLLDAPAVDVDEDAIIVTADHGEELGDGGREYHTAHLAATMTDVPLVSNRPTIRRVNRHVDLPPFLAAIPHAGTPESWIGSRFGTDDPVFLCVRDEVGAIQEDERYVRRLDADVEHGPDWLARYVELRLEYCAQHPIGTGHSGKQDDLSDAVATRLRELGYLDGGEAR